MKSIVASAILGLTSVVAVAQQSGTETYDISPAMISSATERSKYYIEDTFLGSSLTREEFLKKADRNKKTVVYAHGCNNSYEPPETEIRKFYLNLGYNVVMTNFITRGDTGPSCLVRGGVQMEYRANGPQRIKARAMEFDHHVDFLKKNGFADIVAVGYSEGGVVVQAARSNVSSVVVHSAPCVSGRSNAQNRYLQLLSTKDPFVGNSFCDAGNFTVSKSDIASHGPLADPKWKSAIKEFVEGK